MTRLSSICAGWIRRGCFSRQEALDAMPEFRWTNNSYAYVRRALVLAEAHQQLEHLSEGHDWLQNARAAIETHGHERLRPKA